MDKVNKIFESKKAKLKFYGEYLLASIGALLSVIIFLCVQEFEEHNLQAQFEIETTEQANKLSHAIDELNYLLRSIQEIQQMVGLNRRDFRTIGSKAKSSHTAFTELVYTPVVTPPLRAIIERDARRDGFDDFIIHHSDGSVVDTEATTLPELYIYPEPTVTRFGLDISQDNDIRTATNNSLDKGGFYSLPTQNSDGKLVSALILPIFAQDAPVFTKVGRKAHVKGYIILRFDSQEFLTYALKNHLDPLVYTQVDVGTTQIDVSVADGSKSDTHQRSITYPGEQWVLKNTPTLSYIANRKSWLSHGLAASVLVITGFLFYIFRQQRSQKEHIQQEVYVRTAELAAKNRDMLRIFEHVDSGLVTIDHSGQMAPEMSQAMINWFGDPDNSSDIVMYLSQTDPKSAEYLTLGLDAIVEDFLPFELLLRQLPTTWKKNNRTWEVNYLPFSDEEGPKLLLVFKEVTALLAAKAKESERIELAALLHRAMNDREGFTEFVLVTGMMIDELVKRKHTDSVVMARDIHTLKGNCGMFDIKSIANLCHHIEDQLEENGGQPSDEELQQLDTQWKKIYKNVSPFLFTEDEEMVEISQSEYNTIKTFAQKEQLPELVKTINTWQHERILRQFERVESRAIKLAERLGKGPIEVKYPKSDLRIPKGILSPFWSNLTHVIRNAIDHGLESPEERNKLGKTELGCISLNVKTEPNSERVTIEISDNGRGINFERLIEKANKNGINFHRPEDLLFLDGLSSRDQVSSTSGRGVGMAAVKDSVEVLGGQIFVDTEQGKGTTFRFQFDSLK